MGLVYPLRPSYLFSYVANPLERAIARITPPVLLVLIGENVFLTARSCNRSNTNVDMVSFRSEKLTGALGLLSLRGLQKNELLWLDVLGILHRKMLVARAGGRLSRLSHVRSGES